jgi:hypothetical protein
MDPLRFDTVTRELTRSRRGALAAVVGGTLGLLGLAETAGKKGKGKGKKKPKKPKKCTPGICDICTFQVCVNGTCGCAPGNTEQGGVCGSLRQCLSAIQICSTDTDCCSGKCNLSDGANLRCNYSTTNCNIDYDCLDGGPCRGFLCPEEYRRLSGCS